ncbi:MAG TPA: hypothetical protein VF339_01590 [Gammaproteobacteria bacterium]
MPRVLSIAVFSGLESLSSFSFHHALASIDETQGTRKARPVNHAQLETAHLSQNF